MKGKKIICILLSILILLIPFAPFICEDVKAAEVLQFEGWKYTELDDGTVEVSGYTGPSTGELVIPGEINGKKVTSIGIGAFVMRTSLTSVELPSGVTSIGERAFHNCVNLTSVKLPTSVTSIGNCAFGNCSSLTSIELPSGITGIEERTFEYCSSLAGIELPSGVTSIGEKAFYGCKSLISIELPSGVTSIGTRAFYDSDLRIIKLPSSVTSIGSYAFGNDPNVVICGEPNSYAQQYAEKNTMIFIDGDAFLFQDLTYIELDDGTVEILMYAGSQTEIVIPENIDGKKVALIGDKAFYDCNNLTSIELPSGVASIGVKAFYNCKSLAGIELPSNVTSIGEEAFYNCESVASVKMSSSVTSIGERAFSYCRNLTDIEIPSSVTSIGNKTFENCNSLTSITVDTSSENYSSEDGILYNRDKTELIKCPEGKKGKVIIPAGVTSIGEAGFYNCKSLTSVEIPSGVTSIGHWAFRSCESLTRMKIPSGVTSIGMDAFTDCASLTSIEIPSSVTDIGAGWGVFIGCSNLTIYGESGSVAQNYADLYGIKFVVGSMPEEPMPEKPIPVSAPKVGETFTDAKSKAKYKVTGKQTVSYIKTTATSGKVTIPATVKYKGRTFKVTAIYKGAFKNKTGITGVTFGKYITAVGSEAFSGCKKLKTVTLNKSLTKLGDKAFYKCTALTAITIPKNVKKIGKQAFYGCKKLKSITIKTAKLTKSTVGSNAFKGIYSKATIKILKSKKAAYQKLLTSKGAGKYVKYQ